MVKTSEAIKGAGKAKGSIAARILVVATITLIAGLAIIGGAALYLEHQALIGLQRENNLQFANVMADDIKNAMMADDMKKVDAYIKEIIDHKRALALSIFNEKGAERGSGAKADALVTEVLKSGKPAATGAFRDDIHILETVLPLINEERCQGCHDKELKILGALKLDTSIEQGYAASRKATWWLAIAGLVALVTCVTCLMLVIRKTVIRSLQDFVAKVTDLARGEGDLTRLITVQSNDEFSLLADEINALMAKIKNVIALLYTKAERMAETNAIVGKVSAVTTTQANTQREQACQVATAANEMAVTLNDVASNAQEAARCAATMNEAATAGMVVAEEAWDVMNEISSSVTNTKELIDTLESSSDKIGEIVALITDVADQTSLLALNAAIEAARAGEHGRGFAVVADEVKKLAEKTTASTKEITALIKVIQQQSSSSAAAMASGAVQVENGVAKVDAARTCLTRIKSEADGTAMLIAQIAAATEQQSATTGEINSNIQNVAESAEIVLQHSTEGTQGLAKLNDLSEEIFETLGSFRLGNHHDLIKERSTSLMAQVVKRLETAIAAGEITANELFDRNYTLIKDSNPERYNSRFDAFFDKNIAPLQEAAVKDMVYAICVDENGYCPSHNAAFSRQSTGDQKQDLEHCRTKRIFNNYAGRRAAKNKQPFLHQTHMRDTGEILNDISSPIYINGRHWGGLRLAYLTEKEA
ncbi:MAG TPA: methyl-accepting chemotaxis protein [Desulfuromonadaceae bacterium]